MKNDDLMKLLVVAGVGGLLWYLYTQSKGLTLTGEVANTMLPAGDPRLSLVTPSYATSTSGTNVANVFASVNQVLNRFFQSLQRPAGAGNSPAHNSPSFAVPAGLQGPPAGNPGVASIGSVAPYNDPTLSDHDPFWSWGFDVPNAAAGVPAMSWTLRPEDSLIPPPPGA